MDNSVVIYDELADSCILRLRELDHTHQYKGTVPDTRPKEFVWVVNEGSVRNQGYQVGRIRVNVFSPTLDGSKKLAALVDGLLCDAVPDGKPVCKVERESGPIEVADDPTTYRRYALYTVTGHGKNISLSI